MRPMLSALMLLALSVLGLEEPTRPALPPPCDDDDDPVERIRRGLPPRDFPPLPPGYDLGIPQGPASVPSYFRGEVLVERRPEPVSLVVVDDPVDEEEVSRQFGKAHARATRRRARKARKSSGKTSRQRKQKRGW